MHLEPRTTISRLSGPAFHMSMSVPKLTIPISLALILILAAIVRLVGIGDESLWGDETHTAVRIQSSWWTLLAKPIENNQPLHFLLLKAWTAVAGNSDVSLRLPSAIFGLLTVGMTFVLGRRLANEWVALGATLVVAVLPGMVWYSQETRTYAMQAFFAVTSLYLLVRYLEEGRQGHLVGYWLAATLGIYTHFYFGIYIIGNFVAGSLWLLLYRRNAAWGPLFIAHVAVGVSLLPRIPVMMDYYASGIGRTSFTQPPEVFLRGLIRLVGFTVPRQPIATEVIGVVWIAWILIGISATAIVLNPKSRMLFPGVVAGTATGVLFFAGVVVGVPIVGRYLVPTLPLLSIMAAHGVYTLLTIPPIRRREILIPVAGVAAGLVLWLGIYQWGQMRTLDTREDWRTMAAFVDQEAEPGDKVVFETVLALRSFTYYSTGNMQSLRLWVISDWPCENGDAMWLIGRSTADMRKLIEDHSESCDVDTEQSFIFNWVAWRLTPAAGDQATGGVGG